MFETRRFLVRRLTKDDFVGVRRLAVDESVKKYTGVGSALSEEQFHSTYHRLSPSYLAISSRETGAFVGRCGFRESENSIGLEIFLLPEARGCKAGDELFDAMIRQCASMYPTKVVEATVAAENKSAIKLLERFGFTPTNEIVTLKSGVVQQRYIKGPNQSSEPMPQTRHGSS